MLTKAYNSFNVIVEFWFSWCNVVMDFTNLTNVDGYIHTYILYSRSILNIQIKIKNKSTSRKGMDHTCNRPTSNPFEKCIKWMFFLSLFTVCLRFNHSMWNLNNYM